MKAADRIILDTPAICLEILAGQALCRECSLDKTGVIAEADFRTFSTVNPLEFSNHVLKHIMIGELVDSNLATVEYWTKALNSAPQRPGVQV